MDLEPEQQKAVERLLEEYADCFNLQGKRLETAYFISHRIQTDDGGPVYITPYRFPHALKAELDRQIKEMSDKDIIEISNLNCLSPVL